MLYRILLFCQIVDNDVIFTIRSDGNPRDPELCIRDRYNRAQALLNLHVPLAQMQDILTGPDRYAREILEYKLKENEGREGTAG